MALESKSTQPISAQNTSSRKPTAPPSDDESKMVKQKVKKKKTEQANQSSASVLHKKQPISSQTDVPKIKRKKWDFFIS